MCCVTVLKFDVSHFTNSVRCFSAIQLSLRAVLLLLRVDGDRGYIFRGQDFWSEWPTSWPSWTASFIYVFVMGWWTR